MARTPATTFPPCPLCRKPKHMKRSRPLYGVPVCRKCWYSFANRRQLGYVFDWLLWLPVAILLAGVVEDAVTGAGMGPAAGAAVLSFAGWVAIPLVFTMKDGMSGFSPGKFIARVRVVHVETRNPIGPIDSLKRNVVLMIPLVPLFVAFQLGRGARLGDSWSKTKVVPLKYRNHPVFTGQLACVNCQFDLTGNVSGACPECGHPIDDVMQARLDHRDSQGDPGKPATNPPTAPSPDW